MFDETCFSSASSPSKLDDISESQDGCAKKSNGSLSVEAWSLISTDNCSQRSARGNSSGNNVANKPPEAVIQSEYLRQPPSTVAEESLLPILPTQRTISSPHQFVGEKAVSVASEEPNPILRELLTARQLVQLKVARMEEFLPEAKRKLGLRESATIDDVRKEIGKHVRLLGEEDYQTRFRAERLIKSLGPPAVHEVAKAFLETDDAEVKIRTRRILDFNLADCDVSLTVQMAESIRNIEANGQQRKERICEILKDPTQHVGEKELSRACLLKEELMLALRDTGSKAKRDLSHYITRIEQAESSGPVIREIGVERLFLAERLSEERPEEALRQLILAQKDNKSVMHGGLRDTFFSAAKVALNNLMTTDPVAAKRWLAEAKKAGIETTKLGGN
ncbi:MAG: hypothetical protein K2Z81_10210 [Cyanobacteria bacterium]|nr:hypothetical protein [Cyanobacteriota bacterium]